MYRTARKEAGLTLEEAAWRLNVAPRTLGKYESGELDVRPEMALKMGGIYGLPEMLPEHCSKSCPIGRVLQPVFRVGNVATDTLRLLKELRDVNECISGLVEIAADGEVEPNEMSEFESALRELGELAEAIQKLKLLGAKLAREAAMEEVLAA